MAKKREPKESAYQADKEAVPLSSHQLRAWAAELRDLADNLDSRAQDMDVFPVFVPLTHAVAKGSLPRIHREIAPVAARVARRI